MSGLIIKKTAACLLVLSMFFAVGCSVSRHDASLEVTEQNGEYTIVKCKGGKTSITVPAFINGKPVVAVADGAFENIRGLKEVLFEGQSLRTVGKRAFAKNSWLQKVTFPESLQTLGDGAFYSGFALREVTFAGKVEKIGQDAFRNCEVLKAVHAPQGIGTVGRCAFSRCIALQEIDLEKIDVIEELAFASCGQLTGEVTIGATELGDSAFVACDGLTSVSLPNLTKAGKAVFSDCAGLTSAVLNPDFSILAESMFEGCKAFTQLESGLLDTVQPYALHQCLGITELNLAQDAQVYDSGVKNSGVAAKANVFESDDVVTVDGQVYNRVFKDEFDGELNLNNWERCPEWDRGDVFWMDEESYTENGQLMVDISYGDSPDGTKKNVFRSGAVRTNGRFQQTYGYYEIRCKLSDIPGAISAFWLMPYQFSYDGTAHGGAEVDIYECPYLDTEEIAQTIHWGGYEQDHRSVSKTTRIDGMYVGYHTYALKWTDTEYVFYVDGQETYRVTDPDAICHVDTYVKVNAGAGGWAGELDPELLPLHAAEVDYVKVYH